MILSPKHGLNPSIEQCFICGKDKGVILFGYTKGDREAPRKVCINTEPCDECKGYMKQGVIIISVDEKKTDDRRNPYRTGGWVVVRDSFIKKAFNKDIGKEVLKKRICFVPDKAWSTMGLPK